MSPSEQRRLRPDAGGAARRAVAPPDGRRRGGFSVTLEGLRAFYGEQHAVKGVDIDFPRQRGDRDHRAVRLRQVDDGPLHQPHARGDPRRPRRGQRACSTTWTSTRPTVDVTAVRRLIGMVFQKPNPFPTMSIFDNVAAGLRLTGQACERSRRARVEAALRARRPVGRGQGPPRRSRAIGPLRRPAAAAVHRPLDRGRARGDPDGRALLGA